MHDDVAGPIGFEVRAHPYDVGMVELRQRTGLHQKALEPMVEGLALRFPQWDYGRSVRIANRKVPGKVFFHGDSGGESLVQGEVGHPEAAAPKHASHTVLPIEQGAAREGERGPMRLLMTPSRSAGAPDIGRGEAFRTQTRRRQSH